MANLRIAVSSRKTIDNKMKCAVGGLYGGRGTGRMHPYSLGGGGVSGKIGGGVGGSFGGLRFGGN